MPVTESGEVPVAIVEISWVPWTVEEQLILPEAVRVVKFPESAVVLPMGPGEEKVASPRKLAFKLGTTVVEITVSGAVPVVAVEMS